MNVSPEAAAEALPGPLPPGERILWAARPARRDLMRHLFHARALAIAGFLLAAWPVAAALEAGMSLPAALPAALLFLPFAAPVALLVWLLGRTIAPHTLYVATDRRVVLHVGYVYTRTINIPLPAIREVCVRPHAGGVGDIQLGLGPNPPVGWAALAPHARLLRPTRPAPLLRCVPDAEEAAERLTAAIFAAGRAPRGAAPAMALPA